jgi:hypothetical protein
MDKEQGGISIFNKTAFENTRAIGIGVLEIVDEKKVKNEEFISQSTRRAHFSL